MFRTIDFKKGQSMSTLHTDGMCSFPWHVIIHKFPRCVFNSRFFFFFVRPTTCFKKSLKLWHTYKHTDRRATVKWSMLYDPWECKHTVFYYFSPHCHKYYTQMHEQGSTGAPQSIPAEHFSRKPSPVVSIPHCLTETVDGEGIMLQRTNSHIQIE